LDAREAAPGSWRAPRTAAAAASLALWPLALWLVALVPVDWVGRAVAGFAVVFLVPGFFFDRALGRDGFVTRAEAAAGAMAFSIAQVGILAVACSALGLSVVALASSLAAASVGLAVLAARATAGALQRVPAAAHERAPRADASSPAVGTGRLETRIAVGAIVALTAAAAVLAALDANISRDRMWYGAYVTHLAGGAALDWSDPMLGSGHVAWRFAYNAWIAALALWSHLSDVAAPVLLERTAPPLLVALVPSSSYALARALLDDRHCAAVAALGTLVVLFASAYPYFSPERYAFFARIVEDKTAALVLIAPVALALGVRLLGADAGPYGPRAADLARLAAALFATALTHAIVYFIVCLTLAAYAAARVAMRAASLRVAGAVLAACAVVAVVPAALGLRARHDVLAIEAAVPVPNSPAASAIAPERVVDPELTSTEATDPIVRAHARMQRLRTIGAGGPIVEPALLADPVLLLALLGLIAAVGERRRPWGAYAVASSVVFLALAFVPFVAPAFGRLVVPWMAYRALWGVPFGLLLGGLAWSLAARAAGRASARVARSSAIAAILALAVVGAVRLPWSRAALAPSPPRLARGADAGAILGAIASLDTGARIAAAPGLAEIIPANTGRTVLAFSDRGTIAFAGSRRDAEARLVANAMIVGLHGAARRERRALLVRHAVTHVVYDGEPCDLGMHEVHSVGELVLCEVARDAGDDRSGRSSDRAQEAPSGREKAVTVASLRSGSVRCDPAPLAASESFRWQRHGRWSGAYARVTCTAEITAPASAGSVLVTPHLPRAREALVYEVRARSGAGECPAAVGLLALGGDDSGRIPLPCRDARSVTIRMVPAFLPYLNLRDLEILS
jgi:hypothetical protein